MSIIFIDEFNPYLVREKIQYPQSVKGLEKKTNEVSDY